MLRGTRCLIFCFSRDLWNPGYVNFDGSLCINLADMFNCIAPEIYPCFAQDGMEDFDENLLQNFLTECIKDVVHL